MLKRRQSFNRLIVCCILRLSMDSRLRGKSFRAVPGMTVLKLTTTVLKLTI
jgi:hypothetical protein